MIVDTRAVNYETMAVFGRTGKLGLSSPVEDGIQAIAIVSITDLNVPNIFIDEDSENLIQLKFVDADPCDVTTPDGKVPELMTTE
jgi:hypothetical protein